MWQLRESMLRDAFAETGLPEEMQIKWMRIDEAFKQSIIKHSVADCRKRFATDAIIALPDPVVRTATQQIAVTSRAHVEPGPLSST